MARTAQAATVMYRKKFAIALAVIQTMLIILFSMFSRFSDDPAVKALTGKRGMSTEQLWDMGNHYAGTHEHWFSALSQSSGFPRHFVI